MISFQKMASEELPRTGGSDNQMSQPRVGLGFRKEIENNSGERDQN